jgi:hypothetical protein
MEQSSKYSREKKKKIFHLENRKKKNTLNFFENHQSTKFNFKNLA